MLFHLGPAYARLADAARTGQDAYSLAHGGVPFSASLGAPGGGEETFSRAMAAGDGLVSGRLLARARAWGRDARIVDVGGAHGSLLARLLALAGNPATRGVLFDPRAVVAAAWAAWGEAGGGGGARAPSPPVDFVGGDLFDASTLPRLGPGTVAVARFILHDWGDADAVRILRALRAAAVVVEEDEEKVMDGGGRQQGDTGAAPVARTPPSLCLVELVLPPAPTTPPPHPLLALADVNMLAAVRGGRERTAGEWGALLERGGWRLVGVAPVGIVSLLEAVPAGVGGGGRGGLEE